MMTMGSTPESSNEQADEEAPLITEQSLPNSAAELANGLDSVAVAAGAGANEINEIVPVPQVTEEDEIRPDYGATAQKKKKKDAKDPKEKAKKAGQKSVSDALKTDMAAERTFFKWLWTGLHTGAIGSFIFITFDGDKEDPMRLYVVGFSWIVALALVLYGTYAYYRRRYALRTGNIELIPTFIREHSPLVVLLALGLVVGAALGYAGSTGFKPKDTAAGASAFGIG